MNLLCKLGWHRWYKFEDADLVVAEDPRRRLRMYLGRECERCFKRQRYLPGFHNPPYWKDWPIKTKAPGTDLR